MFIKRPHLSSELGRGVVEKTQSQVAVQLEFGECVPLSADEKKLHQPGIMIWGKQRLKRWNRALRVEGVT
jgi:hypothetical protein